MDFPKYIENHFGKWTWVHLFSFTVGFIILLILGDFFIFKNTDRILKARVEAYQKAQGSEIGRWLDRNDPRGFLDLGIGENRKNIYDIAWISGSSISVREAPKEWQVRNRSGYNLTEAFTRYVEKIDDQPIMMHRYLLQGARSGDIRRAVVHAMETPEYDLVLIPINGIFAYNDYLAFTPSKQRARLFSQQNLERIDYQMAATMLSPLEILLNSFHEYNLAYKYRDQTAQKLGAKKFKPFMSGLFQHKSRDTFGTWRNWFFPPEILTGTPKSSWWLRGYRAAMLMQSFDSNNMSRKFFRANARSAALSGKNVLFYVAPHPPEIIEDEILMAHLNKLYESLKEDIEKFGGYTVRLVTSTAFETAQPYEHRDMIHLKHGQGLIDTLVEHIKAEFDVDIQTRTVDYVYE